MGEDPGQRSCTGAPTDTCTAGREETEGDLLEQMRRTQCVGGGGEENKHGPSAAAAAALEELKHPHTTSGRLPLRLPQCEDLATYVEPSLLDQAHLVVHTVAQQVLMGHT